MASHVLLVGEGDFSFAVSLMRKFGHRNVIATCLQERNPDCNDQYRNMTVAKEMGAKVLTNVDARRLHEHRYINHCTIGHIIFNFPHTGGKMKVGENRRLLKEFFLSAGRVLAPGGEVSVTLCAGQGGTPADGEIRRKDDTWKVVEMAAHGGFVLRAVRPFTAAEYEEYSPVGYRSSRKPFRIEGALTHVFRRCLIPALEEPVASSPHDYMVEKIRAAFCKDSHPLRAVSTVLRALSGDGTDGSTPLDDVEWEITEDVGDAFDRRLPQTAERRYVFVPRRSSSPRDPPFEHVVQFASPKWDDVEDRFCKICGVRATVRETCNSVHCRDEKNDSRVLKHVVCKGLCVGTVRHVDGRALYHIGIERTAAALFGLGDWRKLLSWGSEESLYPEEFRLDSSFWIPERFSETDFLRVARLAARDTLHSLSVLERYREESSGRTSMCYRFCYQSLTGALTWDLAKEIHRVVCTASERWLDVTLR